MFGHGLGWGVGGVGARYRLEAGVVRVEAGHGEGGAWAWVE